MTENLETLAYNRIKDAISKGYIKKGSKLKEVSMAKNLNMSRSTVKGAFKRLVFEGMAEYSPNKGTSVVNPSFEEIKESFLVRAHLEKMSTFLAAKELSPEDFKELRALVQKEKDIFKIKALDKYYETNNAIHLKIAEKSGNQVLVHYVKELLQKTTIFLILFDPFYQLLDANHKSPDEHQNIIQWLEQKNGERAGLAMEAHLASTMNGIDVDRLLPDDYLTV